MVLLKFKSILKLKLLFALSIMPFVIVKGLYANELPANEVATDGFSVDEPSYETDVGYRAPAVLGPPIYERQDKSAYSLSDLGTVDARGSIEEDDRTNPSDQADL